MAKRKRATEVAELAPRAEKFITKLATTLSRRYTRRSDVQGDQLANAFQSAISALPAESKLQKTLQQNVDLYTKLLYAQWVKQLQHETENASPAKHAKQVPLTNPPSAPQEVLDSSESSRGAQIEQCLRLLAGTAQLQTESTRDVQPQMGAILAEVQKLLQASLTQYSMPLPAAAVQLIQPVIAQLMTSCLLQAKTGATSVLNQAHLHQADHQLLAQAIALAAEFQQMLGRKSMELRVALVAHDLKSTGCQCHAMFELLLAPTSCGWPSDSLDAKTLWTALYRAAIQCIPPGMSALGYLLTVAVAQKASGNSLDTISGIDTKIAAIPAPKSLLKWLHQQAASTVTRKCQRAAEQGPLVLTSYLMDSTKADELAALRQLLVASSQPRKAEDTEQEADNMLFYVDGAGESAFGKGWKDAEVTEQQGQKEEVQLSADLHSASSSD